MPWFRVDDTLSSHPKARKAGLPALGLWTVAGAYSMQYLTEGFVPEWFVASWPSGRKLAASLVTAGLWHRSESGGEPGWIFHQWEDRQPTRREVEADREANRKRQQAWRDKKRSTSVSNGVTPPVTDGVTNGSPPHPLPIPMPLVPKGTNTNTSSTAAGDLDTDPDFIAFWAAYPKHVDKGHARKAWPKALKTADDAQAIISGAKAYAERQAGNNPKYIAGPAAWLNGERWLDEDAPSAPPPLPLATEIEDPPDGLTDAEYDAWFRAQAARRSG